jgi:hypothetical protein
MNNPVRLAIAAAAVLVVALVGYQLLQSNTGGVGGQPTATPTPTPAPLAVGSFISHGGQIELDASGDGANVTGSMTYADEGGAELGGFTVDLECTHTTAGGLLLIGGPITESTFGYVESAPVGTNIGVVLQRGSPVEAVFWIEHPDPHEPDCPAFLESIPDLDDPDMAGSLEPIEGTIELRP